MKTLIPQRIILLMFLISIGSMSEALAQLTVPFEVTETRDNIRGNLIQTGNDIVGVIRRNGVNFNANDPTNVNFNNGEYTTAFIDVDGDPTTFSSSEAGLTAPREECSELIYAGLYWSANYYIQRGDGVNNFGGNEIGSGSDTNTALIINNGALAQQYTVRYSEFSSDNSDIERAAVTSYLVVAQPANGCGITNGAQLAGNIAVVQEGGSCNNRQKVINAQNAGAIGVVIVSDTGRLPRLLGDGPTINIPSASIGNNDISNANVTNQNLITALNAQTEVVLGTLSTTGGDRIGNLSANDPRKQGPADFRNVKFKVPGGTYVNVTAQSVVFDGYRNTPTNPLGNNANDEVPYVCYADVTTLLDPANPFGTYTLADMNATQGFTPGGDGACGGWMLVAIYEDPEETAKYISISDGFAQIFSGGTAVDFTFTGFTTLQGTQPVEARFGTASLEGDKSLGGDALQIENTAGVFTPLGNGTDLLNDVNPTNNFFNGSISFNDVIIADRTPNSTNTLGFDADLFELPNVGNVLIGNNQTSATFRLFTNRDRFSVFYNAFSVTIIEPELRIIKRVFDSSGVVDIENAPVELGDELFYDLEISNIGNEALVDGSIIITDVLPANTDLLGVVDATLPLGVTYMEISPGVLEFNIPADIVETFEDNIPGGDAPIFIRFRAQLVATCEDLRDACSDVISNQASAVYVGAVSGEPGASLSTSSIDPLCQGNPGEVSNILANVPACEFNVTFCDDDLTLVAGAGYDQYTWSGPSISPPIVTTVNSLDVPNPVTGVYTVVKEDTDPSDGTCMSLSEEFDVTAFREVVHPVLRYVNGTTVYTEVCSSLDIHQILLCGDQDFLIETDFAGFSLQNISWQRLNASGACLLDPNDPCSLLDGDCTDTNWVEEPGGSGNDFTVDEAGDYRIAVEFDGGCFIEFYFSVYKNNYQPLLTMTPIECGNDGSVTVTNVPDDFAFSLTMGGPYTNTTGVFPISAPGDVIVYAIDTTFTGCEYSETINVPEITPVFAVNPTSPTCASENSGDPRGTINITVSAGIDQYFYEISGGTLTSPITVPNNNDPSYTSAGLQPGTYFVEVISNRPSGECMYSESVTIDPPQPFTASVVPYAPATCDTGALVQIIVLEGSGNYLFDDGSGNFQTSNIFEIPNPDPTVTYTFFVSDQNVPTGTPDCIISADITNVSPYEAFTIDNITPINPECPNDGGQIRVEISPAVTGRTYLYELLRTVTCAVDDVTYTPVAQISSPLTTVTFPNVTDYDCYRIRVSHENTTPPGTTPPTICPIVEGPFAIDTDDLIDPTVVLQRELSCIPGSENAIIEITTVIGGSGNYAWSFNPTSGYTNITSFPVNIPVTTDGTYTIYIANQGTPITCAIPRDVSVAPLAEVDNIDITINDSDCNAQTMVVTAVAQPVGPTYTYAVTPAPVSGDANTGVFTLNRAVTYTFTATRTDSQCSLSQDFRRELLPIVQITNAVETMPVTCKGDDDGAFSFGVTNSTTFIYEVTGPLPATAVVASGTSSTTPVSVPGLFAGTYTITVTDTSITPASANCSATTTVEITEPAIALSFIPTPENSDCGADTGTITVTAVGGRGNYQYQLSDAAGTTVIIAYPNTDNEFTGLPAGTYTIRVRDGNSAAACEVPGTATVGQFAAPTIALAIGGDPCYDGTDQATQWVTITPAITPVGPFEYFLDGSLTPTAVTFLATPANTFEIDNLTPGVHTVTVRNTETNCSTAALPFTINEELTIRATLDNDINCNGGATISFAATGGDSSYTYAILNEGTTTVVEDGIVSPYSSVLLVPGGYEIRVTDGLNCVALSNSVTVTAYIPLAFTTLIENDPACPGETGSITVDGVTGEGPFTYILDGDLTTEQGPTGATSVTFNDVSVGLHTVTITDGTGSTPLCILDIPAEVEATDAIVPDIIPGRILSCNAIAADATAQVQIASITGGSGSYEWSLDGTTFTAVTATPFIIDFDTDGAYTLFIRNQATDDCVLPFPITIDPLLEVETVVVTPGVQDCTNQTTAVVLSATPGLTVPTQYLFSITPDPATGAAATGSTPFDPATGFTFTNGVTYRVTAQRDDSGCTNFTDFNEPVIEEIEITSASQTQPVTCLNGNDGALAFTVDTTTFPNFTYTITGPGPATPLVVVATGTYPTDPLTATGLEAGEYIITVTDANASVGTNCLNTETVIITEPTNPVTFTPELVQTCADNTITVTNVMGGNGGAYTYSISNPTTGTFGPQSVTIPFTGVPNDPTDPYTITVFDNTGVCSEVDTLPVNELPAVALSITGSELCLDDNAATIDVSITNGSPDYSYTITRDGIPVIGNTPLGAGVTTFTTPVLTQEGTYIITVTDSVGCSEQVTQVIAEQVAITATFIKDLDCSATPEAQIGVTVTGGNGATSLEININGTGFNPYTGAIPFTTTTAGTYQFRVTDAATPACSADSGIIRVTPAPDPVVNLPTITNPRCNGNADGSVTVNIDTAVGTGPYLVSFDGSAFTSDITYGGLIEGTYNYIVRDAKECEETFQAILTAPPVIIDNIVETDISCDISGVITPGSIAFNTISGGVAPYTLTLLNAADLTPATTSSTNPQLGVLTLASVTFSDLSFGNYILRVIDSNGCDFDFTGSISTTPIFTISTNVVGTCAAGVEATINVTGGAPPYLIREYTPAGTETFIPLNPGPTTHVFPNLSFDSPFTFEVIDDNGCTDIQTLAPPPNPSSIIIVLDENPVGCVGDDDGSIDYTISGYQGTELTYSIFRSNDLVNPITASYVFSNGNPETVIAAGTATGSITDFGPGTYLLRVEETDGGVGDQCNAAVEFTIVESATPLVYDTTRIIDGNCNASSQGVVSVTGGTEPYGFLVVQDGFANPGTYDPSNVVTLDQTINLNWDLYITDDNGCILGPIDLVASVTPDPMFTSVPNFVVDPCTYDNAYEITVLATGIGQLQFGIDDGDTGTTDIPVFENGTATVNPNEYTYTYTIPSASIDTHTLTVRDANGCFDTGTITVYDPLDISALFTAAPDCNVADGEITATVTGTVAGTLTFELLDAAGTTTVIAGVVGTSPFIFTGVAPGSYIVQVIDDGRGPNAGDCPFRTPVTITAPIEPELVTPAINPSISCNGATDGVIEAVLRTIPPPSSVDPTAVYTYEITAPIVRLPQSSPIFENLGFGSYTVVVTATLTNGTGATAIDVVCTDTATYVVDDVTVPVATVVQGDQFDCDGNTNATILISGISGGNGADYTAEITRPDAVVVSNIPLTLPSTSIEAPIPGSYDVQIFDSNNCPSVVYNVVIATYTPMFDPLVAVTQDISCLTPPPAGAGDEIVEVSVQGGSGDYIFEQIDNMDAVIATIDTPPGAPGTAIAQFFNLTAVGTYTFRITDQGDVNGLGLNCDIEITHEVEPFDEIEATIAFVRNLDCFEVAIGQINLNVTEYTGEFNYIVRNTNTGLQVGATQNVPTPFTNPILIDNLPAGTFQVEVEALDAPFCDEISNRIAITQPNELTLALDSNINANCNEDGRVVVSVTGGTGPYTYTATDGAAVTITDITSNTTNEFELPVTLPATSTSYTITVTDDNSCISSPTPLIVAVERTADPTLAPLTVDEVCIHDGSYIISATGTSGVVPPLGTGALQFEISGGNIPPFTPGDARVDGNVSNTAHNFTVTTTGTYTVTAYDENGCPSNTESITILPELLVDADFTTPPICGDSDGIVTATVTGGSDFALNPGNFTFVLNGTNSVGAPVSITQVGAGGEVFINISAGTYTVTVTDNVTGPPVTACTATDSFTLAIPTDPNPTVASAPESCIGAGDGTITVTLNAADTDILYTYQLYVDIGGGVPDVTTIVPDQTGNPVFTNLAAGNYVVRTISASKCAADRLETVGSPTQITASATPGVFTCSGDVLNYPVMIVTIEGGTLDYSITYTTPVSGTVVSESGITDTDLVTPGVQYELVTDEVGDYIFEVTDSKGCATIPVTFTGTVAPFPIMTNPTVAIITDITCAVDEVIDVSVQGGSGDFLFEMIDNVGAVITPPAPIDTPPGINVARFTLPRDLEVYTFRITDQITMCTILVTHEIDKFDFLDVTAVEETPETCFEGLDGRISITVSGYTGPFDYTIIDVATGLEAVDGMGAPIPTATGTITTTADPETVVLPFTATVGNYQVLLEETTDPLCSFPSNAVTIAGPAVPFNIEFLDIVPTEFCNPAANGAFQVSFTGAQGTVSFELALVSAPTVVLQSNTTGLFEGLAAGDYQVTATDTNATFVCTDVDTYMINPPADDVMVSLVPTNSSCFEANDGRIVVNATGTDVPFLYTITPVGGTESGTQTIAEFGPLVPGDYTITVYDSYGCPGTATETITEPAEVIASINSLSVVACGIDVVNVNILGTTSAVGGIVEYFVVDQDGIETSNGPSPDFTLGAGDYQFYVLDDDGCRSKLVGPVPVIPITPMTIELDTDFANINCFNEETGRIDATVRGGIGVYRFSLENTTTGEIWPAGGGTQPESLFIELPPGDYTYTAASDRNCSEVAMFTIVNPAEFENIPPEVTDVLCFGEDNGSVVVFAAGGTVDPEYSFSIRETGSTDIVPFFGDSTDDDPNQHTFTMLAPGDYEVVAQDSRGCSQVYDVSIAEPDQLMINPDDVLILPETCLGDNDGSVSIIVTGGSGTYFTNITNNDADFVEGVFTYDMQPGGPITIFVRDENNCRIDFTVDIPNGVDISATLVPALDCPVFDPISGALIQPVIYYVDFLTTGVDINNTDITYILESVNGDPAPIQDTSEPTRFIVQPNVAYQGSVEHVLGCVRDLGTITVDDYTALSVPIAEMTGNPQDPNEYEITVTGGSGDYAYYVALLEDGMTADQLVDADFRELDSNIFTIRETANYVLRVVDTGIGCEIRIIQRLTYINIAIPNYFTPNGDGTDDVWYPYQIFENDPDPSNSTFFFDDMEVQVFDRYGRLLEKFVGDQGPGGGWGGFYQGKELPSGDYWFTIILNDIDNREFTGHFTLYR